ncbi:MAG: menaquinone biosynthesis protein [Planctomycetota bacterium]|nr:menaquinone biosynthesis protein [Planctomycetota bacterium]MDA1211053.1 menaquinone biosynthesis protein [Planctomycetota bacterium]
MSYSNPKPLRIGAVSYLNSKPLIEGLPELLPETELILDYPSRLADDLSAGELDIALIPSIEVFRNESLEVISNACVAARGPVFSVKLYSRVPWGNVRSLALDEGSRTSAALARIMLAERFGVQPDCVSLPVESELTDVETDAVLLIGDRAMNKAPREFLSTWDLGEEWMTWTGLPFVFALWAARKGNDLGHIDESLQLARDRGVQNIDDIADREAPHLGISSKLATTYLTDNLHFRMGDAERSGLKLFHSLAVQQGLAPEGIDLVFRHYASAR